MDTYVVDAAWANRAARIENEHAAMKALLERLSKSVSKPRSPMLAALEAEARALLTRIDTP